MNSSSYLRRQFILESLESCSYRDRLSIAVDKIIELQDDLFELQQNYMELLIHCKSLCVPTPF